MTLTRELEHSLGLAGIEFRHNLARPALFAEAIANDRGRVRPDGPADEQKAFARMYVFHTRMIIHI